MNLLINFINKPFFKVFTLNSFLVFLKLIFGVVISKLLAVFVGPAGLGVLGNFRVFIAFIENFTLLGIQNATVKYVAENKKEPQKVSEFIIKTFGFLVILCAITMLLLLIFKNQIENYILPNVINFKSVIYVFILCVPFFVFSVFLNAILNGLGWFKKTILVQLIASCIVFLFSAVTIYFFGIYGAFLSLILTPIVTFIIAFMFLQKYLVTNFKLSYTNYNFSLLKNFSEFILMALVSGVLGSLVLLLIRTHLVETVGLEKAGIYEGLQRVSANYMVFISSIVSLYFYPKFAATTTLIEINELVLKYLKTVIPFLLSGLLVLFFIKENVVYLLFNQEFIYMKKLFFWQEVGDLFKALSLIFGTILVAKKMTKIFIITEVISLLIMYWLSYYFINHLNTEGIVLAYAITYFAYFLVMLLVYFKFVLKPKNELAK